MTAILFIRPGDVIAQLDGRPIYEWAIVACLAVSLPAVLRQFTWRSLTSKPASLCVISLLPAIVLSHLSHGNTWSARFDGLDFLKVLVYYLLSIGLLTTRQRLHIFMGVLLACITINSALAILTYHGKLDITELNPISQQTGVDEYGEAVELSRLRGPGIFHDPNDFSLILISGMFIAAQFFIERPGIFRRSLCIGAVACLGYAFFLARSRGGFLALMIALATILFYRYSWRRTILILAVLFPLIIALFGGRQTDFELANSDDTAQSRIHLWRDSLVLFHHSPVFGIGSNQLGEENGLVAHNSYVQGFAELGLIGGTLFVGATYIPFWELSRLCGLIRRKPQHHRDGWASCVLAIMVGYAVGLFSLTRTYVVSTYAVIGLAVAFTSVLAAEHPELPALRPKEIASRIAKVSMGTLLVLEFFARFVAT